MVRWLRWHCPPDTGFEIRALAVWSRARYLSVTEAPHNTDFHTWMGKKHFCFFKPPRPGTEPRTLAWKAAVLTTTLGPPPLYIVVKQSRKHWGLLIAAADATAVEKMVHSKVFSNLAIHKAYSLYHNFDKQLYVPILLLWLHFEFS